MKKPHRINAYPLTLPISRESATFSQMKAITLECKVLSNKALTHDVFEIKFDPQNDSLVFKPGQFISIVIPGAGPGGRDLRRAYSIASAPDVRPIELCVKLVEGGPGTNYLHHLKEGDTFKGQAPFGDFVYKTKTDRHACFIATGTGIAPFRSMAQSQEFQNSLPQSAICLFGVRAERDLLYVEDFEQISNVSFFPALSRAEKNGPEFKGRVTDLLRSFGESFPWKETDYYLCGNGAMITEIKQILMESKGIEKTSIHQEVYYK